MAAASADVTDMVSIVQTIGANSCSFGIMLCMHAFGFCLFDLLIWS